LGPNRSTKMPITIRAGMVSATLRMSRAFHCSSVIENVPLIASLNGAWANHSTKERKKANHEKWSVRIAGERKSRRLSLPSVVGVLMPDGAIHPGLSDRHAISWRAKRGDGE